MDMEGYQELVQSFTQLAPRASAEKVGSRNPGCLTFNTTAADPVPMCFFAQSSASVHNNERVLLRYSHYLPLRSCR